MAYEDAIEILNAPLGSYTTTETEEAIDVAIEALGQQVSKRPKEITESDDNDNADVICPVCGHSNTTAVNTIKHIHCWHCGQAIKIDWSDEQ